MTESNLRTSLHRVRTSEIPSYSILQRLKHSNSITNKELKTLSKKAISNTQKKYNSLFVLEIVTKKERNK